MSLEEKIIRDNPKSVIDQIKESEFPLFIWGNGGVATAVSIYLKNSNVKVEGFFVNEEYFNSNEKNNKVYLMDDILNNYGMVNVVLGHAAYEKGETLKKKYKNVNKVFYIASIIYNQTEKIPYDFFVAHKNEYEIAYNELADEKSKRCMAAYLNARINEDVQYVFDAFYGKINYFKNDVFTIQQDESFLDVGAYVGDTIEGFLLACNGRYRSIFAFEAHGKTYSKLKEYVDNIESDKIKIFNKVLGKEREMIEFCDSEEESGVISEKFNAGNKIFLESVSLDDLYRDNEIDDIISLLKINFFSGVLEVLEGATKLITDMHPKMAITVGFDENAIIQVPKFIKNTWPEYAVYFRFNDAMPARLVLYAVPT